MEYELLVSGIGGQGIQLLSKSLAHAALTEGRHAMLSAEFGGAMRGGHSLATVVVGTEPLRALPVVPSAASAMALHHLFWESGGARLRTDGTLVVNSSLFEDMPAHAGPLFAVPATDIAAEVATTQAAGFALLGAYVAITGLVTLGSVATALEQVIPAYRRQHIEANVRALEAGAAAVPALAAPAGLAARSFAEEAAS
jgi:2-oxoglutarate ferredoxin oxidoreductase subunit gamma